MKYIPTTVSLSGETLDLTLKVYEGNITRLTKQLKTLGIRIDKLNTKKEEMENELAGMMGLISKVTGKEPNSETLKVITGSPVKEAAKDILPSLPKSNY